MAGVDREKYFSVFTWLILVVVAGMLLFPADGVAQGVAPVVEEIRIELTDTPENSAEITQFAENLIYLKEGEPFVAEKFSQSIAALKYSGLFAAIEIPDPDWTQREITLIFRLKPFSLIKGIQIHGGFPLLEQEILNVMTIALGDPFRPELLSKQKIYIEKLFSGAGYIDPKICLLAEKDPADGHVIVAVDIQKGPFYRVKTINIEGNQVFSATRLKMRLQTWHSSKLWGGAAKFSREKLTEDCKILRRFYRKKGYSEVSVTSTIQKERESASVQVEFSIFEGPRYLVSFIGNTTFWDFTLKKDLVLFTAGNSDGLGMRKSIRKIRQRYRTAGYLDAQVTIQEPPALSGTQGTRPVTFVIDEGQRYLVGSIIFSGNRSFSTKKIRQQMLTAPPGFMRVGRYVPETLNDDIRAIKALYVESGFRSVDIEYAIDAKPAVDKAEIIEVNVKLSIKEGPQTIVHQLSIKGSAAPVVDNDAEILAMKAGSPYRKYLLKTEETALAAWISEKGYPHVQVTSSVSISPDGRSADIVYSVDPGPYVKMGQIFFIGNFRTRSKILAREVEITEDEPFSLTNMLATQNNIQSINAVASARFKTIGLLEKAERVNLLAKVQEAKPYFLEIATGYDTERLFYLKLAGGDNNLLGLNKKFRVALEWGQTGYRSELSFNEPRFFGTRIVSSTNLYHEVLEELNTDFGLRTSGAALGLYRQIGNRLSAGLNFQFEYREQYRTDNQPASEQDTDAYELRSIVVGTPSVVYSSIDSFIRPTRGMLAAFSVDVSRGLKNSLDNFFKYQLNGCYYSTPIKRLTLAFRGRIGYIDTLGGNSRIPEDQLFFLGGLQNVRGFAENKLRFDVDNNPVGGRTAILGSMEARFDIGMNFELATFYDTGSVRDTLINAGNDEFRSSVGLALRYITPVGPIGCMYGWKLDRKPGEGSGAFHFAIGYTF